MSCVLPCVNFIPTQTNLICVGLAIECDVELPLECMDLAFWSYWTHIKDQLYLQSMDADQKTVLLLYIYIYIVCTSASACPVPSLIVLHATYIKNKCPLQLGSRSSWLCCSNYNILGLLQTLLEICSLLWLLKCFFVTTPCQTRLETHPLLHVEVVREGI